MTVDPITLQVIQARLAGIVQEMQNSLFRTGYSTIIRESQDASCAILNTQGEVVAQHVVLPLHMGAFPACAAGLLKSYAASEIHEGDAFITHHPYLGGSPHAPDMAVLSPIFYRGDWVGFAANLAHKSDIGGTVPGSGSGSAREIFQEGLHLPPVKWVSRSKSVQEIEAVVAANSRTPTLVIGDLRGQVGAARLGERRIAELMERYGKETIIESTALLSSYTESRVRQTIATWPEGESEGESFVDNDGIDMLHPIRLHVKITKAGEKLHFDFTGCSDQTQGPANIRPPLVRAACAYCLVALVDPFLPVNQGLSRVVEATFRDGSVVNPRFPGAVNTYMPTALTVVEAIFRALAPVVPEKRIVGGSGSAALVLGGYDTGAAGGRGACIVNPGTSDEKRLPSRFGDHRLRRGDLLRLERPGGGGLGHPLGRPVESVFDDVRQGYVSIARARSNYGVVVELVDGEPVLNLSETRILRGEKQKNTGKANPPLL